MGDNVAYCLNSVELEKILFFFLKEKPIEDNLLNALIDNATEWQENLLSLTFSLSRIIERHRDDVIFNQMMISELFHLPDKIFIDIQHCDENFIEYMLRHEHCGEIELEKSLQDVAMKLSEYSYDKNTLRD